MFTDSFLKLRKKTMKQIMYVSVAQRKCPIGRKRKKKSGSVCKENG